MLAWNKMEGLTKKQIGDCFEEEAKKILIENGFEIINCNLPLYSPFDIIAKKKGIEYLVEVKGRTTSDYNDFFGINFTKLWRLFKRKKKVLFLFINSMRDYSLIEFNEIKSVFNKVDLGKTPKGRERISN